MSPPKRGSSPHSRNPSHSKPQPQGQQSSASSPHSRNPSHSKPQPQGQESSASSPHSRNPSHSKPQPPAQQSSPRTPHSRKPSLTQSLRSQEMLNQRLSSYNVDAKGKTKDTGNDRNKQFLRDFFSILDPEGQARLANDVQGCKTDSDIQQLVQSINHGLLIPMKSAGGKTPTDSVVVSPRKGIEDSIENLRAQGIDPITRNQGKLRDHCLKRDGYKCVATGFWSGHHDHPEGVETTSLQAAHIIPFSLGSFNRDSPADTKRHANNWVTINRFFPSLVKMKFKSEQLNDEKNVMMIDKLLHDEFGAFRFCFVATGNKNQYRMKSYKDTITSPLLHLPKDRIMTFRSYDSNWDLPDPELLRIHAALCEFFHMSGHGERVDKILRDFDELGVFAHDGSTNVEEVLASRLSSVGFNTRERSGSDSNAPAKHIKPAERGGQKPHLSGPENKPFQR